MKNVEIKTELEQANEVIESLADRLRTRDREIERLTKLLIDNGIETDVE